MILERGEMRFIEFMFSGLMILLCISDIRFDSCLCFRLRRVDENFGLFIFIIDVV